jgi:hypothetical protein
MFRITHTFGLVAVAVLAGSVFTQSPPALAKTLETGFQASAYGTEVNVGSTVESGRSALSILGCVSQTGLANTNTAASVSLPPVLTSGTIDTRAASETTGTGAAATGSSVVQAVSLLGGLVSATALTSVSTTSRNTTTGVFSVSATGTTFAGLRVAGVPVTGTPAPNTRIGLPGVGYVVLNEQDSRAGAASASLTVTAIHVVVTVTTPLAVAGTQLVVSSASSSLGGPVAGLLSGLAYGASAHVGSTIVAGELFPQPLACLGTGGTARTNAAASVTIPGILGTGTVTDTAEGIADATTVSGEVTSTVQNLDLLSGLVTATVIKAGATASGNPPTLGDDSSFLGLSVAGHPEIGDNVPANTRVSLAGIGTLWLHRVIQAAGGTEVIMVQLVVTAPGNPLGLTTGTVVNVASARIGVS